MTLLSYLKLLAQPSLWRRGRLAEFEMLCLDDGSGWFFVEHHGICLRSEKLMGSELYRPGPMASFFLVQPMAILLNWRVPK